MHLQIRKYALKSGDARQILRQTSDEFVPMLQKIPGFIDLLLVAGKDRSVFSISIFENEDGIEESRRKALEYSQGTPAIREALIESPWIIGGEVKLSAPEDLPAFKPGMQVQVRHRKIQSRIPDSLYQNSREKLVPKLREIPGFVDYLVIETADLSASINVFANAGDIEKSATFAKNWLLSEAEGIIPASWEAIEGEIVFAARSTVGRAAAA